MRIKLSIREFRSTVGTGNIKNRNEKIPETGVFYERFDLRSFTQV